MNKTDGVVLFYNSTMVVHISLSYGKLPGWPQLLLIHLAIFAAIWLITARQLRWIHRWYPLLLLLWFYPEAAMLRHTVIPSDLNGSLISWETTIFPQRFYFTGPLRLSVVTLEGLHAAYCSLFFLIWLPAVIAGRKHREHVGEYIFLVTIAAFVILWIAILFPVSGPASLRSQVMPSGILFIPVADILHAKIGLGGTTFPSATAALSVIATAYAVRFCPRLTFLFLVWLFVILISSVLCTFHYTINTIAGVITGTLFLFWGKRFDARKNR